MEKTSQSHTEVVSDIISGSTDDAIQSSPVGTVQMLSQNKTVLVPTPSPDPKGKPCHEIQCVFRRLKPFMDYQNDFSNFERSA